MTKTKEAPKFVMIPLYGGEIQIKFFPVSHQYWLNGKRKSGVTTALGIIDKSKGLVPWATGLTSEALKIKYLSGIPLTDADFMLAEDEHEIERDRAASIGDKIHDWIENYVKYQIKKKGHEMPEMPEDKAVQIGVSAFLDWEKGLKSIKYISSERVIYSKEHDYMGTLDIEAIVNGVLCVIDIKSSNSLRNLVLGQTAGYIIGDEEEHPEKKYVGRWAIRLSKETEEEYIARMEKKQTKALAKGKTPKSYPPYQVFEARYLDEDVGNLQRDREGFLHALALYRWNSKTDFYTNDK